MISKHTSLIMAAAYLFAAGPITAQDNNAEIISQGKIVYDAQCARCHGAEGKGDGWEANRLYVPPRDFTSGRFKFKSTVAGTPPSDEDLITHIVSHGITGSGMPSFGNLEASAKKAVVAYIKTFSPSLFQSAPEPISYPSNMKSAVDMKKGAEVYEKLQCALCHGPNGRANGTSAFSLVDAWNRPIRPTNLTQGWTYGGGPRAIDVYHRIVAGIDGAPMPSYEGAATHEEMWILSSYIASLQLEENWSNDIYVMKIDGVLPNNAADDAWMKAERSDVILDGYWVQNDKRVPFTVNAVSVQALSNGKEIAFRFNWDDPLKAEGAIPDAFMMAVKPEKLPEDPRANLHSLYAADSPAMNLTLWQSNKESVVYQKKSTLAAAANSGWTSSAEQIGNVTAAYNDGQWTLSFVQPLSGAGLDVMTLKERPAEVGFAIWDGNNNESQQKRPCSRWIRLHMEPKPKKSH